LIARNARMDFHDERVHVKEVYDVGPDLVGYDNSSLGRCNVPVRKAKQNDFGSLLQTLKYRSRIRSADDDGRLGNTCADILGGIACRAQTSVAKY
jgi:hypothetical protein